MLILAAVAALTVQAPEAPPSRAQFTSLRAALDANLLDYPTTRFREVTAKRGVVCGKMNARNRMGAYTGWTDFGALYVEDETSLYIADPDDPPLLLEMLCDGGRRPTSRDYSAEVTHR